MGALSNIFECLRTTQSDGCPRDLLDYSARWLQDTCPLSCRQMAFKVMGGWLQIAPDKVAEAQRYSVVQACVAELSKPGLKPRDCLSHLQLLDCMFIKNFDAEELPD